MSKLITKRPAPSKQSKFKPKDKLHVEGQDDNFKYRWIRVRPDAPIFGGKDVRDWEVAREGEIEVEKLSPFAITPLDSTRRQGDLVLARMPRDLADERNLYYQEKAKLQREAARKPAEMGEVRGSDRKYFTGSLEDDNV
jgi:hypothetical protein